MLPFMASDGSDTTPALAVLFCYLVMALAFWKMAERAKEEPKWFAIVPILNLVLMLKIARKPMWWLILLLIPIVNVVVIVVITMAICERFGLNKWWGLVALISPLNLVLFLYLAFGPKMPGAPAAPAAPPAAPKA